VEQASTSALMDLGSKAISPLTVTSKQQIDKHYVQINLLNGNKTTPAILKECIHASNLTFTPIFVSHIAHVTNRVNFKAGHAVIMHPKGHVMVKIPESQGLYHLTAAECVQHEYANIALSKTSLMEAHCKLSYIACTTIKQMVSTGMITGIEIDPNSNKEFCEACAKGKAVCKPFLKESKTGVDKYGECVHWDL
jgi:hypothetical protein